MTALKNSSFVLLLCALCIFEASAQIKIRNPKETAERQAESRANRRIDQTINRGFDKIEEGIGSIFKKKDKKGEKEDSREEEGNDNRRSADNGDDATVGGSRVSGGDREAAAEEPEKTPFAAYSKFDFIPGERVVASEDFSQDAVGDFPAKWNTNSSAEVVTIEGYEGKWLKFENSNGSFIPDFVNELPENFTLEYDFIYNTAGEGYASQQNLITTVHQTTKKDDRIANEAAGVGAIFGIYLNAGRGLLRLRQTNEYGNHTELRGDRQMHQTLTDDNVGQVFHVALWRQKQRLRIYIDEEKVFDLPRIFPTDVKLNAMRFHAELSRDDDQLFVSNIRLAVGAPDTRSKLITEGKFVTTGITFDVNSADIKPESYGVLKDIANTLKENADIKVKVIGHTDSDGEEDDNLKLSQKRAQAVVDNLVNEFGIDKSRLESDGKGETDPVATNNTPEGKANNRRVEFVKM